MTRGRVSLRIALTAAGALVVPLLVAPPVYANDGPTPEVNLASQEDSNPASNGAEGPRRSAKIVALAGGTCPANVPTGLVRFDGPGKTQLVARARRAGSGTSLTIVSGSGRLGGVKITPADVKGQLTFAQGSMRGTVTINLSAHPTLSRSWQQTVRVKATPVDCGWGGGVRLKAEGSGASVDLSGRLDSAGNYELTGDGVVRISGTPVRVDGWLRSPGKAAYDSASGQIVRSSVMTWRILGATSQDIRVSGARIDDIQLRLTQSASAVRGSATVALQTPRITMPARLEVAGARTWTAGVTGSDGGFWEVPRTDGLIVDTKKMSGTIGERAGSARWTLSAPGRVSIDDLDYRTEVGFTGPDSYTVRAISATGSILGLPGSQRFTAGTTKLNLSKKGSTGALSVIAPGHLLLDMSDAWRATTEYLLVPRTGKDWTFNPTLAYRLRSGNGVIILKGPVTSTGGVDLIASGALDANGTRVPVRGYYERSSFTEGALPKWSLAAFPADARGGKIPLSGGAAKVGGLFVFTGPGAQPVSTIPRPTIPRPKIVATQSVTASEDDTASTPEPAPTPTPEPTPTDAPSEDDSTTSPPDDGTSVAITGTTTLVFSDIDGDTFALPVTYSHTDSENWTITASGTTPSNLYTPFEGLNIPETDFSGTVSDVDGVETWDLNISMQDWQDFSKGVSYLGAFSIGNTCPLADDECPGGDDSAIYIGGQGDIVFDDADVPPLATVGAFTTDLLWARWDAMATETITFAEISLTDADVTIWKGERSDVDPQLVLPDLSALNGNNALEIEFCADFAVPVPDIATLETFGCVAYSPDGVVMGQVNTGGTVDTGSYNGISLEGVTLTGFAYNELDETETLFLNGVEIQAEPGRSYLTGDVVVPGTVMNDLGTGISVSTTITASGWFDNEGNFELDAAIPVYLSGSGFTLQEILIEIGKDGEDFTLFFDAESDVVLSGNHFPLDVYIGYESSDAETITVGLTATGTQSTQSDGTMDFITLLPSGNFEPTNATIVDGSFDGKLPANIPSDGGFERSSTPGNLVANSNFELGMDANVLDNGDFEGGKAGNMLANGDFETTNLLINGDFEENNGSLLGWSTPSTNYTAGITSGYAVGPENQGDYVATLSANVDATTFGLQQTIPVPLGNYGVSVSAWVTSSGSAAAPFHIRIYSNDCSFGVDGASVSAPTGGAWVEATVSATIPGGCDSVTIALIPEKKNTSVKIDAVEFAITSTAGGANLPNVWRPSVVAPFDSLGSSPLQSGYSKTLAINSTEPGTLQANNTDYWMTNSTVGSTPGDFDISYKVYFQGGSGNNDQKAGFGFWLDGDYNTMKGYCFSLHTNDGDGGFAENCKTDYKQLTKISKVSRGTWYQVRLTAVGPTVTAYVTEVESDKVVATSSIDVGEAPIGGMFGQVPLGKNQDNGFLWDDLMFYSLANQTGEQTTTFAPNLVKYGDGKAFAGSGYGTLNANSVSGASFEYSTGETPAQGMTYAYLMWMRSASGTVAGTLDLDAIGGGSDENASTSFSVGTTWTRVAVNLTIADDGHTDLRPSVTITSGGNHLLLIDEQVLQEVPWTPTKGATVAITSDEAYSGSNSLSVVDFAQGSTVQYVFGAPPAAGSTATMTAWVKTTGSPVSAKLLIKEASGSSKTSFTANGTWQQVTVKRNLQGGTQFLTVAVEVDGQSGTIYIDDVVVNVVGVNSSQTSTVGAPSAPPGWIYDELCTSGNSSASADDTAIVINNPAVARSGSGALMLRPISGCLSTAVYTTDVTPSIGATWKGSVWVKGSQTGNDLVVTLQSGFNAVEVPVKVTTDYQRVMLSLDITDDPGPLQIMIEDTNNSGNTTIYADDVSITQLGLSTVDAWTLDPDGGYLSVFGVDDSTAAYAGDGYLYLDNSGSSAGSVYLDDTYTPIAGATHEMSLWVNGVAGSGTASVSLATANASGTTLDTKVVNVRVDPQAGWQLVYFSLPVKNTSAVSISSEITVPAGAALAIDNVESRDINSWSALQPSSGSASITIIDGVRDAVDGMNYLRLATSAGNGGVIDVITLDTNGVAIDVTAGSSYKMQAYVRSTTGATIGGNMSLATGAGERVGTGFVATADWSPVSLELTATRSATSLTPQITLSGAGQLDVDALTLIPLLIEQTDPWSPAGAGVQWQVIEDPANAHDSSYGVMTFTPANAGTGVQKSVTATSTVGEEYSVNAWVRSSSTAITGEVLVTTTGGTQESWSQEFTADGTWQSVSIPMTIAQSGHTGFNVAVLSKTPGVMLYVDDVTLQANLWTPSGTGVTQTLVYDGGSAQSGNSYMELSYEGPGSGSSYVDMAASKDIGGVYAAGTTWVATAYLRSSSTTTLASGQVSLGAPGGSSSSTPVSIGEDWTAVEVTYTVGSTALSSLRVQVYVTGSSVPLEIDSVSLTESGATTSDGVTTPLPHPEAGWLYLWDNAFGIPGAYLWAVSAQVDFVDGLPGLGVSATLYQDPTAIPDLMSGTDWIKGDMAVNFSEDDPCFLFDFDTTGESGVSIADGLFTATDFSIDFAPMGCQVGDYTIDQGASLSFIGGLGDASINFDIDITEGDDGPVFTEDLGITDMNIGGIDFKETQLSIYLSTTDDSVTLAGDMVMPMGEFNGSYDLSVNEDEMQMDGSVALTDWQFAGGGFDVEEFDFDMSMTVPFGADECGSFSSDTSGLMQMGSKTSLSFTGDIALNCGELETLVLEYDYSHGAITQTFALDYDSSTGLLAGGVAFTFERSTSWKFWFHTFNRHPYFNISLDYSMDVNDPASTLEATLSGTVSVSGGSGSLTCTLVAGSGTNWADDECSIDVKITAGGGHEYKSTW